MTSDQALLFALTPTGDVMAFSSRKSMPSDTASDARQRLNWLRNPENATHIATRDRDAGPESWMSVYDPHYWTGHRLRLHLQGTEFLLPSFDVYVSKPASPSQDPDDETEGSSCGIVE